MAGMENESKMTMSQPDAQPAPTQEAAVSQGGTGNGLAPAPVPPCIYTRHTYHKRETLPLMEGEDAPRIRETQIDVLTLVAGKFPEGMAQFMGNVNVGMRLPTGEEDQLRFQFPIEGVSTIEEAFANQEAALTKATPGIQAEMRAMRQEMAAQLRKPIIVGPNGQPKGKPPIAGRSAIKLVQ